MLLQLPRDVIWLILKHCLNDMYNNMGVNSIKNNIHKERFIARKNYDWRCCNWFVKTFDKNTAHHNSRYLAFFVDFLYPLRLVCQQFNNLLITKIRKRTDGHFAFIHVLF
jgi:GTP-dependent phosphoenolpyruvate carboxykinase